MNEPAWTNAEIDLWRDLSTARSRRMRYEDMLNRHNALFQMVILIGVLCLAAMFVRI